MTPFLSRLIAPRSSARPTAPRFQPQLETLETRAIPGMVGNILKHIHISHIVSSHGISRLPSMGSLLSLPPGQTIVVRH